MVAGHPVTGPGEEASKLRTLGVEPAVDDVLATFEESTPEEIMALEERRSTGRDADGRDDDLTVDDATFDGFVTEDVRPIPRADEGGDERGDLPGMDDLFGGR